MESLFALGIFLIVAGTIAYADYKNEEARKTIWKELAQANYLKFVPGEWAGLTSRGFSVQGEYRGCYLSLERVIENRGRTSYTFTQISVSAELLPAQDISTNKFPLGQPLSVDKILDLLVADSPDYRSESRDDGIIKVHNMGRSLIYGQSGFEADPDFLQGLFDLLTQIIHNYSKVLVLEGDAMVALKSLATDRESLLYTVAYQLMLDIEQETTSRLSNYIYNRFCPRCLTRCGKYKTQVTGFKDVTYYGCRTCGQSREFLKGSLIAVLNSQMKGELIEQQENIWVNWLQRRSLFDFNRVEIVWTSDEDVERFAVQVGNDTDKWRKPRYKQMRCVVSVQCQLSENTLRILERMFGEVRVEKLL